MNITFNSASMMSQFPSADEAKRALCQLLSLKKRLQEDDVTNKVRFYGVAVDITLVLTEKGEKFVQVCNGLTQHEKSLLLSWLSRLQTVPDSGKDFKLNDYVIRIPDVDSMLISLLSNSYYDNSELIGTLCNQSHAIKNIARMSHIDAHRHVLGIRRYEANDEKHKPDRENAYGKGKIASRMDLTDAEAQTLLNRAVEIEGRLYAEKDGICYAFMNHADNRYHGYRDDEPSENVRRRLKIR